MMMKMREAPVEVEEAEEVAVATKPKVAGLKTANRLSRRPRKTSPLYETTEP